MKNNQLKMGVILSYISTGIAMLTNLIYTPVMIRLLGQSEYGLYTLVGSVVSYLSLFSLGFTGSYLRFYSRYESRGDSKAVSNLNGMYLLIFTIMGILALICGFILSFFSDGIFGDKLELWELEKAKILMRILVINISVTFPSSVFHSFMTSKEKFIFPRLVGIIHHIVSPFICLPLLLLGYGSVGIVVVSTILTITDFFINIYYCIYKLKIKIRFEHFDFKLLKEMSQFSFFIFLNMIMDKIFFSVDKFILGRVIGTTAVAVYGVGSTVNDLYMTFSTSISSVFTPRIYKYSNEDDSGIKFTEILIKVGRIQFIVLMLVLTGFIFFGKYFVTNIYATNEYVEAYYVAIILCVFITGPLIQNISIEILRSINKHQFYNVVYFIISILNLLISIPLSKLWGPVGATIGTAISYFLSIIIFNIYYYYAAGMDMFKFWKNIILQCKGLIIPCILGFIIIKYVEFKNIIFYLMYIVLYTLVYCISMYIFGMNNAERNLINNSIKKLKSLCKIKSLDKR